MRKITFAASLLAAAFATPAMAQDAEAPGRFHVEAIVGYDAPQGDVDDVSGVTYGIGAGYDFHLGRHLTVGPEAELSSSSAGECGSSIIRAGDQLCVDAGRDIYVGGRIGYRFGSERNHLAYIGAGYTNAEFRSTYDANLAGTTGDFDITDQEDGYRLKAGVEFGLGRNAFVRGEYRYSRYDDADLDRHQAVAAIGLRF